MSWSLFRTKLDEERFESEDEEELEEGAVEGLSGSGFLRLLFADLGTLAWHRGMKEPISGEKY